MAKRYSRSTRVRVRKAVSIARDERGGQISQCARCGQQANGYAFCFKCSKKGRTKRRWQGKKSGESA